MTIKLKWVRRSGRYVEGKELLLGDIVVAEVSYNIFREKNKSKELWCSNVFLPGIASCRIETETEAKDYAEKAVREWIKKARLCACEE